jgi:hypothetical protein
MTVATTTDRNRYDGTGSQSVFPYTFPILQDSDLEVRLIDSSGEVTVLVLDTDYEMTGAGTDEGGDVEIIGTLPAADEQIFIIRKVPYTQPTDYKNEGRFFPRTHEKSFDRACMQIQQLSARLPFAGSVAGDGSALKIPTGWSAARTGTGTYEVTHDLDFASPNDYVVTATTCDGDVYFVMSVEKTADTFTVYVVDSTHSLDDADFNFILVRVDEGQGAA